MKKLIAVISAALIMGTLFVGCSSDTGSNSETGTSSETKLTGSLTLSGSSALQPLAQEAADELKENNPDLSIIVNAGGSGKGLTDVSNKSVDIGNSDIFAENKLDKDKADSLKDHEVCIVGVAPVINPQANVRNLTSAQLQDVFTGKITNWSEVGGADIPVVLIGRPTSSGTRALFKEKALDNKDEETANSLQQDDSGILAQAVVQTKGAISYLAFSYTSKDGLQKVSIDGVEPTYDNIYEGKYNVWGYEHMYTNGEPSETAQAFIDYMTSAEFSSTVTEMGYGEVSKLKNK